MNDSSPNVLDEQAERISIIQHVAKEFLAGEWSNEQFRKLIDSGDGYDPGLWDKMCALGWPGLLLTEDEGGSEASFSELAVIAEECGRALAPSPLVSHVTAGEIVRGAQSKSVTQDLLAAVAKGAVPLTTAAIESELTNDRLTIAMTAGCDGDGFVLSGEKRFVQAARDASTLVVAARLDGALALFAVPRGTAGVDVERLKPLDWSALDSVKFDSVVVPAESLIAKGTEAERLLREALCQSDILLSAELCGLAEAALDLAVEYAKIRETYGKPIGQYQAVKHRLVNLRADIEIGKALVRAAAGAVTSQSAGWRLASAQAAYWSIDAVKKVPEGCLQVFGGIGFTWEHDIHLYLRRCATLASQLGERAEHREVIVEALDKGRFGGASADAA